jgi:hypothetical protein
MFEQFYQGIINFSRKHKTLIPSVFSEVELRNVTPVITYALAFLSIPLLFLICVYTEDFVGYKFVAIIKNIDGNLPLMPPDYYLFLLLLLIGTIFFTFQLWNERDTLKDQVKRLNNRQRKRRFKKKNRSYY